MKFIYKYVDPFTLQPNPWNSNKVSRKNFEKLKASVDKHGHFKPMTVRELDDGTYQILGGYHRNEAAKELGFTEVPIVILNDISDEQAKEIGLIDNSRYGEDDKELLEKILEDIGDLEALEAVMPESLSVDVPAEDEFLEELLKDTEDEKEELPFKILKFKFDNDKAEEIEAVLEAAASDRGLTYSDGFANLSDALYYLLVEKR